MSILELVKGQERKVSPAPHQALYPVSAFQKRLYVIYQLDPESTSYNMYTAIRIENEVQIEAMEAAFMKLIERHELLRTSFVNIDGVPFQKINDTVDFSVKRYDGEQTSQYYIKDFVRPFQLETAPLFRVAVVRQDSGYLLLIDQHHIISDAASQKILLSEFIRIYSGEALVSPGIQYKDYAYWQSGDSYASIAQRAESFWRKEFERELVPLDLPLDYERPALKSTQGASINRQFGKDRTARVLRMARRSNTTLSTLFFTAYYIFLNKITGQKDITIGLPSSGRAMKELEGMPGPFINMLAVRCLVDAHKRFADVLLEVKSKVLRAIENQDFQYDELVAALGGNRNSSRNPLFDVVFLFRDYNFNDPNTDGSGSLQLNYHNYELTSCNFDLQLRIDYVEEDIRISFDYNVKLFKKETISRFVNYFEILLSEILDFPDKKIFQAEILPEAERHLLLHTFNATTADLPVITVQDWFARQVTGHPDRIAIVEGDLQLSYSVLDERSTGLSALLIRKGVAPNALVCLLAGSSINMVIGMLAIVKAGAAYVPIDPAIPEERILQIFGDCNAGMLVHNGNPLAGLPALEQIDLQDLANYECEPILSSLTHSPGSPLYVIFTSGSTGAPKGVLVNQQSLVNFVYTHESLYGNFDDYRTTQLCNVGFDAMAMEVWLPLLRGGTLLVPARESKTNVIELKEYLQKHGVTFIFLPTPLGEQLLKMDWSDRHVSLKSFSLGGEKLNYTIDRVYPFRVFNVYGPTEDTILSTWNEISRYAPDGAIIGVPFRNKKIYVLDEEANLMPVGFTGEICISGAGVARGYLNRPELTHERFVGNPIDKKGKLYRTGDMGKWQAEGQIAFVGRKDNQVKINGNRIELWEIRNRLAAYPGIEDVIVTVFPHGDSKHICAYYTGVAAEEGDLKDFLKSYLPSYMLPAYIIWLKEFPLNANGKTDRKALPEPETVMRGGYLAPRHEADLRIRKVWGELLHLEPEKISMNSNFFELGGHSMKAIELCSNLQKVFGRKVKLADIFSHLTVMEQADFIRLAERDQFLVIKPAVEKEYYELSSTQKRLFLLSQFEPDSIAYNIPLVLQVDEAVDTVGLKWAVDKLMQRHEILRTRMAMVDGRPVQIIQPELEFLLEEYTNPDAATNEVIAAFIRPFDLFSAPLFRMAVVTTREQESFILIDKHHIISDGSSEIIFLKELLSLYQGNSLPEPLLQYKDYSEWQHSNRYLLDLSAQKEFWLSQFKEDFPTLDLTTDYPYPAVRSYEGDSVSFALSNMETRALYELVMRHHSTLFSVLLSMLNIFLNKLSGQEDIIIGTLTNGRNHAELKGLLGAFINTLALRNQPEGNKPFSQFLGEVTDKVIRAFENQDYLYEDMLEQLSLERTPGRNVLFNSFFALQNLEAEGLEKEAAHFTESPYDRNVSLFDLTFQVVEKKKGLHFSIGYYTKIFKKETVSRYAHYLQNIIRLLIQAPDTLISAVDLVSADEKRKLSEGFSQTATELELQTVVSVIEAQAARTPFRAAISHRGVDLSYAQLNERANRQARRLKSYTSEPGASVVLLLDRGIGMIQSILAIWKAGLVYIPLDRSFPEDRLLYILRDSNARVLITERAFLSEAIRSGFSGQILLLDEEDAFEGFSSDAYPSRSQSSDVAYVIYTSGSTGDPKGVMVTHLGMLNHMRAKADLVGEGDDRVIAQTATQVFDISIWQFFTALLNGGKTIVYDNELILDPPALVDRLRQDAVNVWEVVPSYLSVLMSDHRNELGCLGRLEYLIVTGEELSGPLVRESFSTLPWVKIVNAYGPTEASDDVSHYILTADMPIDYHSRVPIGSPVRNTRIYVLDASLKPCPIGIKGEICISGPGLAKGYLNDTRRTAISFIRNPYGEGLYEGLYRTGDLGYWTAEGELIFLGRLDHQVKIRGNRVELGEIEHKLLLHPRIRESVVMVLEKGTDKHLYACYRSDEPIDEDAIKAHLSGLLPAYMTPSRFLWVQSMPLTTSGKIDRKALPVPDPGSLRTIQQPQDRQEEEMRSLWAELLKTDAALISTDDSFFAIGGHSLRAMELIARIQDRFGRRIPMSEIFRLQTIKEICSHIRRLEKPDHAAIPVAGDKPYYELSSMQKRLFIMDRLNNSNLSFNISGIVQMEEPIDEARADLAFRKLLERHAILRTSFVLIDGEAKQRVQEISPFRCASFTADTAADIEAILGRFVRPFDLGQAPLLRAGVIRCSNGEHLLVYDIHHIVADGVSLNIILDEFHQYYQGKDPAPLALQYTDYAEWQHSPVNAVELKKQQDYWLDRLQGDLPKMDLPLDFPRPREFSFQGDMCTLSLGAAFSGRIKALSRKEGTTVYSTILALLNVLLYKYTGVEDILIGSALSGREHPALQNMVGTFVNTLVIRNRPRGDQHFEDLLGEVGASLQEAYGHMDYQFDDLVDQLNPIRDTSRNPIIDLCLSSQNFTSKTQDDHLPFVSAYSINNRRSKLDLTIYLHEGEEEITLVAEYYAAIFKRETIDRLLQHMLIIAEKVTASPRVRLKELSMVSAAEEEQILREFSRNRKDLPPRLTFHGLFEEQAHRTPLAIALKHGARSLSYYELDRYTNQLANFLLGQEIYAKGDLVGLLITDPILQVAAMLGVLKAGLVFVPIDGTFPEERISHVFNDGRIRIACTDQENADTIARIQGRSTLQQLCICLDGAGRAGIGQASGDAVDVQTKGGDSAYVIYTSGSTGKPKGVEIGHLGIANTLLWRKNEFAFSEGQPVLQLFSYVFDGFLTSVFSPLFGGATMVLLGREETKDLMKVKRTIIESNIIHFVCVPSMYEQLVDLLSAEEASSIECVALAGEKVRPELIAKSLKKWQHVRIANEYGPTENSVSASVFKWVSEDRCNIIGRPIPNVDILILDKDGKLCPVGVAGELCISGIGLAKGYLGQPELTAEKFSEHPFYAGERLYHSGDKVRWLADGNIEYFFRADNQIKLRGYRIELGEIEHVISNIPGVGEAAVIYLKRPEEVNGVLLAYYAGTADTQAIKDGIRQKLPDYFLPASIVKVEKLPRLLSGKIDRNALPLFQKEEAIPAGAQGSEMEEKLKDIWSSILLKEKEVLSPDVNFFDLGGHSLIAIELVVKISKTFNREIQLIDIFEHPTIREQLELLSRSVISEGITIKPAAVKDSYPLSHSQKRLYIQHFLEGEGLGYNMPSFYELMTAVDVQLVKKALEELVQRHASLRTSFEMREEGVCQVIHTSPDLLEFDFKAIEEDRVEAVLKAFIRPFDLHNKSLFRSILVKTETNRCILGVDMHHIVSDGLSVSLLIAEFVQLYGGALPPLPPLQYKDLAEWQQGEEAKKLRLQQENYWIDRFRKKIPPIELPFDLALTPQQTFSVAALKFTINPGLAKALYDVSAAESVTPFMVFFAAYCIMLHHICGQNELVVGIPVNGRNHPDLEKVVGPFINTLPLSVRILPADSCREIIMRIKEDLLAGFTNQDYPLQDLVEKLNLKRDAYRSPLFDILFTFTSFGRQQQSTIPEVFDARPYVLPDSVSSSKYYLSFECVDNSEVISGRLVYRTEVFRSDTARLMIDSLLRVLEETLTDIRMPLSQLKPLSRSLSSPEDETLFSFNF